MRPAWGRLNASDVEVERAAQLARVDEFANQLGAGLDTTIGERGARLSGGQRQRVAIARAVLKNPPILILDEATSALDAQSEHLVRAALLTLMVGRTTIVIAHRLSTVEHADCIVVLSDGKAVASGSHGDLLGRRDEYRRLHALMNGPEEQDHD